MNKWDNYAKTLLAHDDARRREEAEKEKLFRANIIDSATRLWDYIVKSDGYAFCTERGAAFSRFDEAQFRWPDVLRVRVMAVTIPKSMKSHKTNEINVSIVLRFTDGYSNISNINEHSSIYWHYSYFSFAPSAIDRQSGSDTFIRIGSAIDVEKYIVDKLIAHQKVQ